MFHKKTNGLLITALALLAVFTLTACEKLKISTLKANYHFNKANQLFKDEKFRNAIDEYEAALKANPKMIQAYRYLGESYNKLYKPGVDTPFNKSLEEKAIDSLKKAYDIDPNNKDVILSLGRMYDVTKNFKEAEALYRKILRLEPINVTNFYVMAEFYKNNRSTDNPEIAKKVEQMYLRRIEVDPENLAGYLYYASYLEKDALGSAEDIFAGINKAGFIRDLTVKLDPNNPEVWTGLGINRWSKAYRFPAMVPAEERLAIARDGIRVLEKAIALDSNYAIPYIWISVLYKSVLAKVEPEKESRYFAEADKAANKYNELNKRAAGRKDLEKELKETK